MAAAAHLPGTVGVMHWKVPAADGVDFTAAYGMTAPPGQEAAVQGIHAAGKMLWLVDEAGGIERTIGKAIRTTLTGDARGLYVGNPPADADGSWFEDVANSDRVYTVTIPITDTPNFTGEVTARCRLHSQLPPHSVASHLPDEAYRAGLEADYGIDSPWYQAKVLARFPKGGGARVLPSTWVDDAAADGQTPDPEGVPGAVRSSHLSASYAVRQPRPGAWVRLGVDVAAGGGDELAVSRAEGSTVRLRRVRGGAANANALDVAGLIKEEIVEADALRRRLGTAAKVRVKIDVIGVGWGVASVLEAWADEGLIDADIVWVDVRESVEPARVGDKTSPMRPALKRDEMWLCMRSLLQPQPGPDGDPLQAVTLDCDDRTRAQLAGPKYRHNSRGDVVIESKDSMKARGIPSPDRAESMLLATYEPFDLHQRRRRLIIAGA